MKYLPNLITVLRLLCALTLFFTIPFTGLFWLFYLLGGFSDIIDGWLARKLKATSRIGALLDSLADLLFLLVLAYLLVPYFTWPTWLLLWLGVIVVLRIGAVLLALVKYRRPAFLHTYANKLTGLALFAFPLLIFLLGFTATAIILCLLASYAALEELIIISKVKNWDSNITSMWAGKRSEDSSKHVK